MTTMNRAPIDLRDPEALYALVAALPPGRAADRAWAEYAAVCRAYRHLATVLALIGVEEARIPALAQADERAFDCAVAAAYRAHVEGTGYVWLPELARARGGGLP